MMSSCLSCVLRPLLPMRLGTPRWPCPQPWEVFILICTHGRVVDELPSKVMDEPRSLQSSPACAGTRRTGLFRRMPGNYPLNLRECHKAKRSTVHTQGLPEPSALRPGVPVRPGTPSRPASMSLQCLAPHLCIARCSFVCVPKDEHAPPEEVQAQRQQAGQQGPQAQVEGAAPQVQLAPHVLLNQVVSGLTVSIHQLGLHNGNAVSTSGLSLSKACWQAPTAVPAQAQRD